MTIQADPTVAAKIRQQLQLQDGEHLYCIVDACQDRNFAFLANSRYGQPFRSLFKGCAAEGMEDYAPYFIPIDLDTDFLEQFCARLNKNIGILFTSSAKPIAIFRHLREIFIVQDESGQEHFFRFYDPRVLKSYIESSDQTEIKDLSGPVKFLSQNIRMLGNQHFSIEHF